MGLIGIPFPDPEKWHNLLQRITRVGRGSRAFYIALGDWLNSLEYGEKSGGDHSSFRAYKVFKRAIKKFGKDPILLSGVAINMFSSYEQNYAKKGFIEDILEFGRDYLTLKKDQLGDLSYMSEILSDLEIYLKEKRLNESNLKVIELELEVRERMFEIQPSDAENLCSLAYDCQTLGKKLRREFYCKTAINLAKRGELMDTDFFGEVTFVNQNQIEERLNSYLKIASKT